MIGFVRRLVALTSSYARVRRRTIADAGDAALGEDETLLERARAAMPPGYDVDSIFEYTDVEPRAAEAWMEAQYGHRGTFRYLPLLGRDCFTFAKDALQRAGAPVLLWQLYLQRGDGAIARLRRRGRG